MNLAMAVGAAPIEEENRRRPSRSARMLGCDMALSADPWVRNFEKPIVDRAMRFVTIGTTFHCGRMFPKKWTAPLRVAGVAVFIDASLLELRGIRTPVRVVAVGTGELPFSERHM